MPAPDDFLTPNAPTWCPGCGGLLVERSGYTILQQRVTRQGACPDCGAHIPGIWG